jgi:hypothetical protein
MHNSGLRALSVAAILRISTPYPLSFTVPIELPPEKPVSLADLIE